MTFGNAVRDFFCVGAGVQKCNVKFENKVLVWGTLATVKLQWGYLSTIKGISITLLHNLRVSTPVKQKVILLCLAKDSVFMVTYQIKDFKEGHLLKGQLAMNEFLKSN